MSPPGIIHYLLALVGTTPVPTNSITSDALASHSHAEDFRKEGEESAQVWEEVCVRLTQPQRALLGHLLCFSYVILVKLADAAELPCLCKTGLIIPVTRNYSKC